MSIAVEHSPPVYTPHATGAPKRAMPHALVMMLLIIIAAVALTYVVPSGEFARDKQGLVTPGSFEPAEPSVMHA